jgi:hypothetical protein
MRAMIRAEDQTMTGDRITAAMEEDAAAVDIPAAGTLEEDMAVTAGRAGKAMMSGRKCTSC